MTRREQGLTLIELMVSILLTTILIGGVFYMVSGQQRTYTAQLNSLTAQENLWGAMEYLQGQIRRAGYGFGGCGGEMRANYNGSEMVLEAAAFRNAFSLLTAAADPKGSDSFQVLYAQDAGGGSLGVRIVKGMPIPSAILDTSAPGGIKKDDLVVIWNPGDTVSWCSVMQATQDAQPNAGGATYNVQHNPASVWNTSNNREWPAGGYPPGSILMNLGGLGNPRRFAIDHSRNPPQLVTWSDPSQNDLEVVADGIEDLQLSWACDMNSDGALTEGRTDTERQSDEWGFNVAGDVPPTCQLPAGCVGSACSRVPIAIVRVTLVARSASPVPGDRLGSRPGAEDQPAGSMADDLTASGSVGTYSRAVLTATVMPRNITGKQ